MKRILSLLTLILIFNTINAQTTEDLKNNSLQTASIISVTVGGDFIITGTFPSTFIERADQFITRIYNETYSKALQSLRDTKLIEQLNEQFKSIPLRGIILKRAGGQSLNIDLLKFRLNGDFVNNPYLKNDDVIIFPPSDMKKNFFTINGAVNKPGKFYFVEGDKLSDAIELAQGINKAYDNITSVEISRLSYEGNKIELIKTDMESNISLKRGDQIRLLAEETQRLDFHVTVVGEVNMPGYIPITKSNTTLYEAIKRAGGIKETASISHSKLLSGNVANYILASKYGLKLETNNLLSVQEISDKFLELENILMSRMSNLTEEDTSYFFTENQLRALMSESSIDFTELNDKNSKASNYILNDGDIIIIPKIDNTVYVFGQVGKTGKISFKEGENYLYYVNNAGGFSNYSDEDVIVIKGKTKEWLTASDNKTKIEPGDYIWVPKEPHMSFNYYLKQTSVYFAIIGSIATILLLLNQFGK
ncbi:MAG: hypothetical protein CO128_04720 [Ignavibacteriales bacterium CG_4_9_14_3_um_filter_30_11]|nr:MAG: hypothetical protein CO128_04720 [Ignavibacteriales bacterium CG_4_9_14_3_um_filter_30_11]